LKSRHGLNVSNRGGSQYFRFTLHGSRLFNDSRFTAFIFMRLDQYLRASRLVLRRSVAQELCEAGAVEVGGHAARASRTVRAGDLVTIRRRGRALTVRVTALPAAKQVSRAEAPTLYEVVSDIRTEEADGL
jgi:ribosomal 50S subunit-recycling heat shock protein